MTDIAAAEALLSFSKVNSAILKKLDRLEKNVAIEKKPEEVVESIQPVEIEGFGVQATRQITKILQQQNQQFRDIQKKSSRESAQNKSPSFGLNLNANLGNLAGNIGDMLAKGALAAVIGGIAFDVLKKAFSGEGGIPEIKATTKIIAETVSKVADSGLKAIETVTAKLEKSVSDSVTKLSEKKIAEASAKAAEEVAAKVAKNALVPGTEKGLTEFFTRSAAKRTAQEAAVSKVGNISGPSSVPYTPQKPYTPPAGAQPIKTIPFKKPPTGAAQSAVKVPQGGPGSLWESIKDTAGSFKEKGVQLSEKYLLGPLGFIKKAAQSKLLPSLLKVISFPGVIDTIFALNEFDTAVKDYKSDKIDKKELYSRITSAAAGGLGGFLGGPLGGLIGAGTTPFFPPLGAFLGRIAGTALGDIGARKLVDFLNPENKQAFGKGVLELLMKATPFLYEDFKEKYKNDGTQEGVGTTSKLPISTETDEIDDGVITRGNKVIKPHSDDTIYAMKEGGPFDKFFTSNIKMVKENNTILKDYALNSSDMFSQQIKLLSENNRLLTTLVNKLNNSTNVISRPTIISNSYGEMSSLRMLQGVSA